MPAAKPPPGDWFDDPITDVFPLQPMRVYVQVAFDTIRLGMATRASALRQQREEAWANYRASIKGLPAQDARRVNRSTWLSVWVHMVESIDQTWPKIRDKSETARPRRDWAYESAKPMHAEGAHWNWHVTLIVQGDYDASANVSHVTYDTIDFRELNWLTLDGRRVRATMQNAYLKAVEHMGEPDSRAFGSRIRYFAANATSLVHHE